MVCISRRLGCTLPFFPEKPGKVTSPSLPGVLKDFRDDFTVMSGLSHPEMGFAHSIFSFLTAAPIGDQGRLSQPISLDQFAASAIGGETRFPSLTLADRASACPGPERRVVPSDASRLACSRLFLERPDESAQADVCAGRASSTVALADDAAGSRGDREA
jgi:hypothetical protein